MNFQQHDLEELKKHPRVLDLYKNRLHLKKEGSRFRGLCPFHEDRRANNFDVFLSDGTYIYKCLSCGVAGSIIDLIQKTDTVDFKTALTVIKEFCSARGQNRESVNRVWPDKKTEYTTLSLPHYQQFEKSLSENKTAQAWLFTERGITYETAKRLRLGFVQDIGKRAGENNPLAAKGWIVFPSFDRDEVIDIKYRSIVAKKLGDHSGFCKQGGMAKGADAVLHGLESIDVFEPILVTEGELDRAVLEQAEFRSVSVPNGAESSLSAAMMDRLTGAECIILAGDSDVPGMKLMMRLWNQLGGKTYLLTWPIPYKDATDFFLSGCGRNIDKFRSEVTNLIEGAKAKPMQGVYNIQQSLQTTQNSQFIDHPDRLPMPWKSINDMVMILPGTVTTVYSTESGMGKSTWMLQASIHMAKAAKKIVLNYQAEMSPIQIDAIVASHVLKKDRLHLKPEDYKLAAKVLGDDFKYYIGRDTSLTTIGQVLDLIEKGLERFGAEVVILDNLHFLCRNEDDQVKAQANAMQRITNMTAKHNLYFFVVHQARKADQNRKRQITHVSDLDGSKAIQNDSTTIISIHRDEIKHSSDNTGMMEHEYSPITEIRLQKCRDKGEGKSYTRLLFSGKICTFSDITNIQEPAPQTEAADSIF
jgi:hypothetical protein